MCLLFSRINYEADGDEYKLILVNNRDEYWKRPTKLAQFWPHNPSCISGIDVHPGREGGTWLGMNSNGRVGVLLNILSQGERHHRGRGFLVSDFISSTVNSRTYLERVARDKQCYKGFHLALFDYRNGRYGVDYLSNSTPECNSLLSKEYICLSNSSVFSPWQKVVHGESEFASIVQNYGTTDQKDELVDCLFDFMFDKTQYFPDSVLDRQGRSGNYSENFIRDLSANYVWCPEEACSTRTTTVILVSGNQQCDYIEKTLVIPVNIDSPKYVLKAFQFNLKSS